MIAPARLAAYDALRDVWSGRVDLATAIARARRSLSDERDRALASEIATGVERWRGTLDHLVQTRAKRPLAKLDPEVLDILRIALYQLLHLTRVPASAVVDDAVDMTKKMGKTSASGFVNAMLRGLSRTRAALPLPPPPAAATDREAALAYLTVTLSHPEWLAARWYDRLGFDGAVAWMQFNNRSAPLTLRANQSHATVDMLLTRLGEHDIAARRGLYAPEAVVVDGGSVAAADLPPSWSVVQDEASQLVALLAGADPGPRVLDTCAAPGGKTTAIAAAMAGRGMLVASDLRTRRLQLLAGTLREAGVDIARLVQLDLRSPLPFGDIFDTVFVDAPCSGLGTLRRDPDIKWRRRPEDIAAFGQSQRHMLQQAAGSVRPGGRLIYATCSSEPEENEDVAAAFLDARPDFRPIAASASHPQLPAAVVDHRGHLRTSPDRHQLENFFGALFERQRPQR